MALQPLKLVYEIQNGQFKGQKKTAVIQVDVPDSEHWEKALWGVVGATGALGNLLSLVLYVKSIRGTGPVFEEIGRRFTALQPSVSDLSRPLDAGEIELAEFDVATMNPLPEAAAAAEAEVVAVGALDAAAAASIVPGIGWVAAASLMAVGAVISAGLAVYAIVSSAQKSLVSVIFINGVPNSKLAFTKAEWEPGLTLVGSDTKESIENDAANSTMETAGALAYTWQIDSGKPSGTASIELDFGNGTKPTANLAWSVDPERGTHECTLTAVTGGDLLQAFCYKQPVPHPNGHDQHYILLYLIVPSTNGAPRVLFTKTPTRPLVNDNTWAIDTGSFTFGRFSDDAYYTLAASFEVVGQDYTLTDIELPLSLTEPATAVIELCHDDAGSPGTVIETWHTNTLTSPTTILASATNAALHIGTRYWITVGTTDLSTTGYWSACGFLQGLAGSKANGGSYVTAESNAFYRFAVGGAPAH